MELEVAKKLIKEAMEGHASVIVKSMTAESYYLGDNDITRPKPKNQEVENPLRNANNRKPHNFYGLLVNQKASYMFTYPPMFDVGNDAADKRVAELLGQKYAKVCKKLCVNASNSGIAWLHFWVDDNGNFKYGVVDSKQVIPVWGGQLEDELQAVLRTYKKTIGSEHYDIYEYWTDTECQAFRKLSSKSYDEGFEAYNMFTTILIDTREQRQEDVLRHEYGQVPFIPFKNNDACLSDLKAVKGLIDVYDKTYNGFANDLEDIQEIIFILSGYEGENLGEFLGNIKKYKTIKVEGDKESKSGLQTLTIDIPVEAREKLLTMTRKAIFEQGQGVDPDPQNFGNASGVALKYLYSLLELKAGLLETEFRESLDAFGRAICKHYGIPFTNIGQTWTRNAIQNDLEQSQICQNSVGIASEKTIIKNSPLVEDVAAEMKQKEEESKEEEFKPVTTKKVGGTGEE